MENCNTIVDIILKNMKYFTKRSYNNKKAKE